MSNFLKRTKRASEELDYDELHSNQSKNDKDMLYTVVKMDEFLRRLLARVALQSPYYEEARQLQIDIEKLKNTVSGA